MTPLESSKLFNGLSPAQIGDLKKVTRELSFPAGDVIFREGDQGDGIYIVKEGVVQIGAIVGNGDRRALSRVGPGDLFGEMAVLDREPRSATASAEEDTAVYFIPREELLQLLEKMPQLSACLVREISRRLRDFNRQYIQEVLQSERLALVGRFARSIVHDLKNPLNIIGISAEMAGTEKASPETRAAAKQRIRNQVDRISNMVNELLEFTRGTQTSVVLVATDYATYIHQLVEEIRPELHLKSVSVEFENEPPPTKVRMNPQRLSRVFYNLLHNATDAMPDGGSIKLRFKQTDQDVVTEIEDTGQGIPPEIADKLFQAFATFGKAHGTGLGLSITKKIIEDHRGKIYTRSEPGRGAIFVFHLPRHGS